MSMGHLVDVSAKVLTDRKLILEEVMVVAKGKLTSSRRTTTPRIVELARHAESLGGRYCDHTTIYFRLPRILDYNIGTILAQLPTYRLWRSTILRSWQV